MPYLYRCRFVSAGILTLLLILTGCRPAVPPPVEPPPPAKPNKQAPSPSPKEIAKPALPKPYEHMGCRWRFSESRFRVFAPDAEKMELLLYDSAGGGFPEVVEFLSTGDQSFQAEVSGNQAGRYYTYRVFAPDGKTHEVTDPWATCTARSSSRCLIVPPAPLSRSKLPLVAPPCDAVIYEMHIRDFTISPDSGVSANHKGRYLGWTETNTHHPKSEDLSTGLAHLKELGITHVQLMPIQDFDNDEYHAPYHWGYMTHSYFSPEGGYASHSDTDARITELKQLINTLHQAGIGVILDVAYNHTAFNAPFGYLGDQAYYRHFPDGERANGSGCGNEFKSESEMGRRLVVETLEHWLREYGVDGFRFDLMALMDVETMRQVVQRLRAIHPHILLYGEPWAADRSALEDPLCDLHGIGQVEITGVFNDAFRNALKGPPGGSDPGFIQDGSAKGIVEQGIGGQENWGLSPDRIIQYMTCHDDLALLDKLKRSCPSASEDELQRRSMLGFLILLTSQGIPFLHGGEEFLRSKNGNENSFEGGDEINQIRWSLKHKYRRHFQWVRALIIMRKEHSVFRLQNYEEIHQRLRFHHSEKPDVLMYTIRGDGLDGESWNEVMVVANTSAQEAATLDLPAGVWNLRFSSDPEMQRQRSTQRARMTVPPLAGAVYYRTGNLQ